MRREATLRLERNSLRKRIVKGARFYAECVGKKCVYTLIENRAKIVMELIKWRWIWEFTRSTVLSRLNVCRNAQWQFGRRSSHPRLPTTHGQQNSDLIHPPLRPSWSKLRACSVGRIVPPAMGCQLVHASSPLLHTGPLGRSHAVGETQKDLGWAKAASLVYEYFLVMCI